MDGGDTTGMIKLLIILCSLFIAFPLYANPCMQMLMGGTTGTAAPPAACVTQAAPTDRATFVDYSSICTNTAQDWFYSEFEAGENATVCKFCVSLASSTSTSPSYNLTGHIYSKGATYPNEALENGTYSTVNLTGLLSNSGYTDICFTGGSASVTSGTRYFIVLNCSDIDLTNQLRVGRDSDCLDADSNQVEHIGTSTDGSTWGATSTARCALQTLWK